MSRQINQPINQVRLTNVAVVRHTVKGLRFEIACYRNKVLDYRAGLETDLSEVLQTERVFTNVSKGKFAAAADLKKAFGNTEQEKIAKLILDQGKIQVSDLERQHLLENTQTQIATWVSDNCVHSVSKRPFTMSHIQSALSNFPVQPHKALKRQYLDAVKFLKDVLPIERAKMELSFEYNPSDEEIIKETLSAVEVESYRKNNGGGPQTVVVFQVDPSHYRRLNEICETLKDARLEIIQHKVVNTDETFDSQQATETISKVVDNDYTYDEEAMKLRGKLEELGIWSESAPTKEEVGKKQLELSVHPDSDHGTDSQQEETDSSSDEAFHASGGNRRKNQRKAQKKEKKKNKRQQEGQSPAEQSKDTSHETSFVREGPAPASTEVPSNNSQEEAGKSCNTCGGVFHNNASYRAHFRSDWHRFNQKLKVKGLQPVSEQEFLLCDAEAFFSGDL
jgi:ribosome maturation protein SDO1